MAKRRTETGKTGKHGREGLDFEFEESEKRRKRGIIIAVVVIVVVIVVMLYFLYPSIFGIEDEEDKDVLTASALYNEGNPNETISFEFSLYNPSDESDVYSPMIYGLPSGWNDTLPNTISIESKESLNKEFLITPSPLAINNTYPFKLNLTSANTQKTYSLDYQLTVTRISSGMDMLCYNNSHQTEAGRSTDYMILVSNTGNGEDTITFSYAESQLPANWSISFEHDSLDVQGYESEVVIVTVTTYSNTSQGRYDIDITATADSGTSKNIRLNTTVVTDLGDHTMSEGDLVMVNYIGVFTDGRTFDSSYFEVANNSAIPKTSDFTIRPSYNPLGVYIGPEDPNTSDPYVQVITGFWEGILGLKVGETGVVRFSPEKGYNDGEWRLFEITVVSLDG